MIIKIVIAISCLITGYIAGVFSMIDWRKVNKKIKERKENKNNV